MAHTLKHARRLLSELEPHLPSGAERVLESRSYWDPGFFDLFLEYTEELIFREPQAGLEVAQVALRLVHTLPDGPTPKSRRVHQTRMVRAYAVTGSASRVTRCLDSAEELFRKAAGFCRGAGAPRIAQAELCWRRAELRADQKRYGEALKLTRDSSRLYRAEGHLQGLGIALAIRGMVYALNRRFAEAVSTLSKALGTYKLPPRAEYSATHNLGCALAEADNPDLAMAERHLHRARQMLGPRRSVQKSRLYWIEGMIFLRRGSAFIERGEQRLLRALTGFLKFQVPYEIALVSLDLSTLLRFQKRWPELEELAAATYRGFRKLREDSQALAALKLWLDASRSRSLSEELIFEVKTTLEARMRREGTAVHQPNRS